MKSTHSPLRAKLMALTKLVLLWFVVFLFGGFLVVTVNGAPNRGRAAILAEESKADALASGYQNDIVLIKGKEGSGSGFIAEIKGKKFLVSNAHVFADIKSPTLSLIDQKPLKLGAAFVAVGHDIVGITVVEGGSAIPVTDSVENEAKIKDAVIVLGNPGSGEVITDLDGKLLGIGPNRIEVDATVEHGNSGSPIIHVSSGKVIGVVSDFRADDLITGRKKIRRFGYRLDSVKIWQAIDWPRFYGEAESLEKFEHTTDELARATKEVSFGSSFPRFGRPADRKYTYDTPAIRKAVDSFYQAPRQKTSDADQALKNLLATLQSISIGDTYFARSKFTYDYFKRRLADNITDREELMNLFAKSVEK